MNEQHANTKSASPLGEGERIACHAVAKRRREVRGLMGSSESDNPHPTLSLEKREAKSAQLPDSKVEALVSHLHADRFRFNHLTH
jgi:hypothetical protein